MTGSTWNRKQESALDHALTNKPEAIKNYFKIQIDYSDHNLICVDMKINVQKIQKNSTTARDYCKISIVIPNFPEKIEQEKLECT